MSTINISLPSKQAETIDKLVNTYGFANRSEFIRSILRVILTDDFLVKRAISYPFISPKLKSGSTILKEFKATKKYSREFLTDLQEGLELSDYFK